MCLFRDLPEWPFRKPSSQKKKRTKTEWEKNKTGKKKSKIRRQAKDFEQSRKVGQNPVYSILFNYAFMGVAKSTDEITSVEQNEATRENKSYVQHRISLVTQRGKNT